MINDEFQTIGLYEHNVESYKKVKKAFEAGQDVVGIVHATGTGKSYNALQLAYDNKDKKIIYVVPSIGIIEHIKKIIDDNPNLNMKRDFPNLEFRTYQSFISLDKKEIENIPCDLLILDEFHHIGAPVWGARINTMIETHPNAKVFGMTAYTVRDRGTSYERDMSNSDTNELFSRKIESRYDLCDAMIDGVLPKPVYKSAYINLIGLESKLEERVQKLDASTKDYQECMSILSDIKRRIHEAPSIQNILRKSIKPNGKYIYFCPPRSEEGTNDIETIKKQATEWFKQFVPEENIIIYTSTSDMGEIGRQNRDAFYNDVTLEGEKVDGKLRVMFAINQYNEGIHSPNIDGVIMGRGTTSDIVYFEQLGRALSVRGNTKEQFDELEKHSIEELTLMCESKDIPIKENISKEELIEKLLAPVVIDLTNNYDYIKELENNLKDRIKVLQAKGTTTHQRIKIRDASFDIEIENQNLFEMLKYVSDRLTATWEDYYEFAKLYYEHHSNLLVPFNFKTNDGFTYDENGTINLGMWISTQRSRFSNLSPERQQLLHEISFVLSAYEDQWQKNYELAKLYYEHHDNLLVPINFKTNDGFTYDKNGIVNLGNWVNNQKGKFSNLSPERQQSLQAIGLVLNPRENQWQKNYEFAKLYYEHHGNLFVPYKFKTNDGFTYDENGTINLGRWITKQRFKFSDLSPERQQLLQTIGFILDAYEGQWQKNYKFAKLYYEHHGNLLVQTNFRTNDGFTYDENGTIKLGYWIQEQRKKFSDLSPEHQQSLQAIGFVSNVLEDQWQKNYELAKLYYEHHGNLLIPFFFYTNDGFTYDENGKINLGSWISRQRKYFSNLSPERQQSLQAIGFVSNVLEDQWQKNYELAKLYYEHHGDLLVPFNFKTNDGFTYDENGTINLGNWIKKQRSKFSDLSPECQQLLQKINLKLNPSEEQWQKNYELAKLYYEHHGDLMVPQNFRTNDGFTYDEHGTVKLGTWISNQRNKFSNLSPKRQQLLQEIGFVLNPLEEQWQEKYELAKLYYEHHGDLMVPQNFRTNDGFTYDKNGDVKLGLWISKQRKCFSNLSPEHQQSLQEIGFVLNIHKKQWQEKYEYAKLYYEHHGDLLVPRKFKTNDGFTYEENGNVKLGSWILEQRRYFSDLSPERQQLLLEIGFVLDLSEKEWQDNYKLAKSYYEHRGNLLIPFFFYTNDGFTYDEKAKFDLGVWVFKQRVHFSELSPEHQQLLLEIGIVLEPPEEQNEKTMH